VALLALAAFINYVDRGNLATAGPLIGEQFALTNTQLGLLLSAFFWSYAPCQLSAGWLAERLEARRVLAAGLAMWGAATALTGFAGGFTGLLVLRIALGAGESVMYPASFKILAREAHESQRGRANGLLAAGQLAGPAFGTLAGGLVMAWYGWRPVFVVAGLVSLLWLWPWLRTPPAQPQVLRAAESGGPATVALLRKRQLWGMCLGNFCHVYALYVILSWLPVYLVKMHGLSMAQMAPVGGAVYLLSACSSVVTGWVSDRWLMAGAGTDRVRKSALLAGMAGLAVCLSAGAAARPAGALAALAGCGVCLGVLTPAIFASVQTLAGARAAARWMGVQNFFASLAALSAPVITGVAVDRTGTFASAFLVAAFLALLGMLAFAFIVRRVEPVEWGTMASREVLAALRRGGMNKRPRRRG
jgi:MFS family permease